MLCQENVEDLRKVHNLYMSSSLCSLFFVKSKYGRKMKVQSHVRLLEPCWAPKHQSDHLHSEVLHSFSFPIKEHHQGDKDLVKRHVRE